VKLYMRTHTGEKPFKCELWEAVEILSITILYILEKNQTVVKYVGNRFE
jgi:hypothetical protein